MIICITKKAKKDITQLCNASNKSTIKDMPAFRTSRLHKIKEMEKGHKGPPF